MAQTILITGATDGIGLAAARELAHLGHTLLVHGRDPQKIDTVVADLSAEADGTINGLCADLADLQQVQALAAEVSLQVETLDVLINNAGVFHTTNTITNDGLDIRFVVNALAPLLLTTSLLPQLSAGSRVVNLSSAAQQRVDLEALKGQVTLDHFAAYAQSKLALTMWSRWWAQSPEAAGLVVTAVNPGSMLGTKMVQQGFGVPGGDIGIGADILLRAAVGEEFTNATGTYFDNDSGTFTDPHSDALDATRSSQVISEMSALISDLTK